MGETPSSASLSADVSNARLNPLARDRRLLTGGAWGAILGAVAGHFLGVILKRRIPGHR
jgi:hypothetical protein